MITPFPMPPITPPIKPIDPIDPHDFDGQDWIKLFEIIGKIVKDIVNFIADVIHELNKIYLTVSHEIKKFLAVFMSVPGGALLVIIAVALIVIFSGEIAAIATGFLDNVGITAIMTAVEQAAGKVAVFLHLKEVIAVHEILMIMWSEYENLFTPLYKAIGGLSADLGYDAHFITLLVQNTRNVIGSSLVLMGLPPETIQMTTFDETLNFLVRAEENFHKYAVDPELLLNDMVNSLVMPYYRTASEVQSTILQNIDDNTNGLISFTENFRKLKTNVDTLFRDLPDEIEDAIMSWYGPISEKIDMFYDKYFDPLKNKVVILEDKIDDYNIELREHNERIRKMEEEKIRKLYVDLARGDENAKEEAKALNALVNMSIQSATSKIANVISAAFDQIKNYRVKPLVFNGGLKFMGYERETVFDGVEESAIPKTWQVGDY